MISLLAQADGASGNPSVLDNEVLDEWQIPFGSWVDQAVDWIFLNLGWLLDAIEWPFTFLLEMVVDNFLVKVAWIWIVLGFFLLGSLVRNVKVGLFTAGALTLCGLLGNAYWIETAKTIGFIAVAVFLCVLIGIPVGVACGRFDSLWGAVRPILDAMQVVHSFVYMLPFIYFFGIGEEAATMVTMVFALPPLIRLTNLGIRQVPADVVEASRAFGAPERRVLFDVQLPLARPAIMTGLNQTLLLAISMLGIAAIMGAGGLGRLLFRAINNQDVALSGSAGLAFFLVAVVLDRISQPEGESGSLFSRIKAAWAHRRDPEVLLVAEADDEAARGEADDATDDDEPVSHEGEAESVSPRERTGLWAAGAGAVVALVALALPWANDAGLVSGHGRAGDLDLAGSSFNGVEASGGSWFGFAVLGFGVWVVLAVADTLSRQGRTARFLSADGALLGSIGMLVGAVSYLVLSPSPSVVAYSDGVGPWLAAVAAAAAVAGAATATWSAPFMSRRPLDPGVGWFRVAAVVVAALVVLAGTFSGWSFDQRADSVITPEIQAQVDELRAEAEADPALEAQNAQEIQSILNAASRTNVAVHDAWNDDGAQLGWLTMLLMVLALVVILPAAGLFVATEEARWRWSVAAVGTGIGLLVVSMGWIISLARVAEPGFVSGVGAFLVALAGLFVIGSSVGLVSEFVRARVYDDPDLTEGAGSAAAGADEPDTPPVTVPV